jgi:hypothetical protein
VAGKLGGENWRNVFGPAARPELDANISNSSASCNRNRRKQFGDQRLKIAKAIGTSTQNNDGDGERRKILLEGEIPIDSDKYVKLFGGQRK